MPGCTACGGGSPWLAPSSRAAAAAAIIAAASAVNARTSSLLMVDRSAYNQAQRMWERKGATGKGGRSTTLQTHIISVCVSDDGALVTLHARARSSFALLSLEQS